MCGHTTKVHHSSCQVPDFVQGFPAFPGRYGFDFANDLIEGNGRVEGPGLVSPGEELERSPLEAIGNEPVDAQTGITATKDENIPRPVKTARGHDHVLAFENGRGHALIAHAKGERSFLTNVSQQFDVQSHHRCIRRR